MVYLKIPGSFDPAPFGLKKLGTAMENMRFPLLSISEILKTQLSSELRKVEIIFFLIWSKAAIIHQILKDGPAATLVSR